MIQVCDSYLALRERLLRRQSIAGPVLVAAGGVSLLAIVLGAWRHGKPSMFFYEDGFVTTYSALQFFLTGCLAGGIYLIRRAVHGLWDLRSPGLIWLLICAGFFFLVADELLEIHERIDGSIHWLLGAEETAWSDRLDDVIILAYMIAGIIALWLYRGELLAYRSVTPLLAWGFAIGVGSVVLDIVTNRDDVIVWLITDRTLGGWVKTIASIGEEVLKLFAGAIFLAVAYRCLWIARGLT